MELVRGDLEMRKKILSVMLVSLILLSGCGTGSSKPAGDVGTQQTSDVEEQGDLKNNSDEEKQDNSQNESDTASKETVEVSTEPVMELNVEDNIIDDNNRMYYEVFVYAFDDSDGDGIGDIKGLTEKLDYIKDLGCNGIWLMPVNSSTTYHKYDVTDYYAIDKEYGTLEDFQEFLKECDSRGIKVIMDLVLNHSSSEHPWFKEAAEYLKTLSDGQEPDPAVCPSVDYYFFTREEKKKGYAKLAGTDFYYEAQFWEGMPDLNLGSEALRTEIEKIMSYWLDMGVGGFRLDAVKEYYSGSADDNVEVISWIVDYCKSVKEDAYIVGEAWDSKNVIEKYYGSGIDSLFNFPFGQSEGTICKDIRKAGDGKKGKALAEDIVKYHDMIRNVNDKATDAPFLSNHDVGRISGFLMHDPDKMKFAEAVNILMSGNSFLYYGEELGMDGSVKGSPGKDENKRAPMYWNTRGDDGMAKGSPDMDKVEHKFASYEEQKVDNESIYNYIRNVIKIRNAFPQIGRGVETVAEEITDGDIVALWKEYDGEKVLLLMNNSDQDKTIEIPEIDGRRLELAAGLGINGTELEEADGSVKLTAFGVAVLK